ncbi:hypothetical protein ACQ4M4_02830 [Leptolyngbya sp. AN02str]
MMLTYATITTTQGLLVEQPKRRSTGLKRALLRWKAHQRRQGRVA